MTSCKVKNVAWWKQKEESLNTQVSVFLPADRSKGLIAEVLPNIHQLRPEQCGVLTPPTQQAVSVLKVKLQLPLL